MRDRNKAARAVLRSEIYRGVRRGAGAAPRRAEAAAPRSRARDGAASPGRRQGSGGTPAVTALALLGLLDLFKGG